MLHCHWCHNLIEQLTCLFNENTNVYYIKSNTRLRILNMILEVISNDYQICIISFPVTIISPLTMLYVDAHCKNKMRGNDKHLKDFNVRRLMKIFIVYV